MIRKIYLPYNAQFYKIKENHQVTNDSIINILNEASKNKKSTRYIINHFRKDKEVELSSFKYSLRVYQSKKKVDFIGDEQYFDIIHAFILIIEFPNHLVIFKKSTSTITSSLTLKFELINYKEILNLVDESTYIQRASVRNMTISENAIHSQSYETTGNLDGLLSMHSAGKKILNNMRIKQDSRTKSLTSSTGRIIESMGKYQIDSLYLWARKHLRIMTSVGNNKFLEKFSQPISLHEVLLISQPKAILINSHSIKDDIDNTLIEFVLYKENSLQKYKKLPKIVVAKILTLIEEVYEFENQEILKEGFEESIGILKINDKSLTFNVPLLKRISIRENNKCVSLQQYIIANKLYSIVFDNFKYMYFMGMCFEDVSGKSEIDSIMKILKVQSRFNNVNDEKGTLSSSHEKFDEESMFDAVEDIHADDDYIFCDDLGIEWCDHITINIKTKKINFIHSKADSSVSLSASKMHEVVGQGIKNLGNMMFTIEDLKDIKRDKFNQKYKRDKVESKIKRIRKGSLKKIDFQKINNIINNYKTHRECILSCSFLSKRDIVLAFEKIKNDEPVKGNIFQLFWIISSFIHACRGSNIIPTIYCKE